MVPAPHGGIQSVDNDADTQQGPEMPGDMEGAHGSLSLSPEYSR